MQEKDHLSILKEAIEQKGIIAIWNKFHQDLLQDGRDERECEVPIDDRWNTREYFEDRFEESAYARRGVFAQVCGTRQADRNRQQSRTEDDEQRPVEKRQDTERLRLQKRRPLRAKKEFPD